MIWKYFLELITVSFTKLFSFAANFSSSLSKKKTQIFFIKNKVLKNLCYTCTKRTMNQVYPHPCSCSSGIPFHSSSWCYLGDVHALFLASATSSVICKYLHISCFFISSQRQCCAYDTQSRTAPYLYLPYFGLFGRYLHYIVK